MSDLAGIIKKVREVVRFFRKSPVRNDALQKEIKKEIGKELQLKLDCRTRWNSLYTMIETILKVKKSVIQTLADLNNDFIITDQDFDTLEMIGKSLKPVKMAAEALCRRDATLLVAEGIFRFLLKQLQQHNHNWLSQALYVAILKRVQERRHRNVVSLMRFLSCPSTLTQHDNEPFTMPTRLNIQKCAKSLMLRLFPLYRPDDNDPYTDGGSRETDVNDNAMHKKLEDQLEQSILLATTQKTESDDEYKSIAKDMLAYEASGKRPKNLDLLMDALESIPPTSVESERIFSITGKILTKQRARMSDKMLDALVFLKAWYKTQEKV